MPELRSLLAEKRLDTKGRAKKERVDRLLEAEEGGNTDPSTAGRVGAQPQEILSETHLDEGISEHCSNDKPQCTSAV